jgi:ABC-2 type transport system permease protein
MNIFFRELRFYSKGLIFWGIGVFILIWSSVVKYDTLQSTGQSITELIGQFPQSVQTIFGLTGFDLSTQSGFFGVMYMYLALTVTIHAVLLGAGLISKEERDRTSEFLFVKPVTRDKVITAKLLAGMVNIAILNITTLIVSVVYFHKDDGFVGDILTLMSGLFFLQIIFFLIGTAIAASSKRPKLSASMASAVLLVAFIMTYLINFNKYLDFLKYLTPFKYFDAKDILASGKLDITYVALSLSIIAISTVITYVAYNKRDLDV